MLGLDSATGEALYMKWIGHESDQDFLDAIDQIKEQGYHIQAVVVDGGSGLKVAKQLYPTQMCQSHFVSIIKRKQTMHPQLLASQELLKLVLELKNSNKHEFTEKYNEWLNKWADFLKARTISSVSNRWQYKHKTIRSATKTFKYMLPFLFTFEDHPGLNIPNANNEIEGVFTALKKDMSNHNGMSKENKKTALRLGFLGIGDIA